MSHGNRRVATDGPAAGDPHVPTKQPGDMGGTSATSPGGKVFVRPAVTRALLRSAVVGGLVVLTALPARADRAEKEEVGGVLLSLFMGGFGHSDPDMELPASDAWLALRSQRNLALDEPIDEVMNLASHNAFNAMRHGFTRAPPWAPNQIMSIDEQLTLGSRLIELDIHDNDFSGNGDTRLRVYHSDPLAGSMLVGQALARVGPWMRKHPNAVVFLDFEDATGGPEGADPDRSIDLALRAQFGDPEKENANSMIFTPEDRRALGRWPSRRELIAMGKRLIIFSHRNDDKNGRFGTRAAWDDADGHRWWQAGLSFWSPEGRGNFLQEPVDTLPARVIGEPLLLRKPKVFTCMQSDGLDITFLSWHLILPSVVLYPFSTVTLLGFQKAVDLYLAGMDAERAKPEHVRWAVRNNVNFLKMDFLFCHDEDAGLGTDLTFDDAYEMQSESRIGRLQAMVWSWFPGDAAVQRQLFQDLQPGDGSGARLRDDFALRWPAVNMLDFEVRGDAARNSGHDYAMMLPLGTFSNPQGRWFSATAAGRIVIEGTPFDFGRRPFALRSTEPDTNTRRYRWRISEFMGDADEAGDIPVSELLDEDGYVYAYGAPVNGLQNDDLARARLESTDGVANLPVWINVHDTDRDGHWSPNEGIEAPPPPIIVHCPPDITLECGTALGPVAAGWATVTADVATTLVYTDTVIQGYGCAGNYEIEREWRASAAGRADGTCTQRIYVRDTTPPEVALNGGAFVVVECGTGPWDDPGITAQDSCDEGPLQVVVGGSTVLWDRVGTYVRTYYALDDCGNASATLRRTIVIVDTQPPVVTLNGPAEMFVECGVQLYVEFGAGAYDLCEGAIASIEIEGLVETTRVGTYYIGYTASDSRGNKSAQVLRTIHVRDTLPPQLACKVDVDVMWPPDGKLREVGLVAAASDVCDGAVPLHLYVYSRTPHGPAPRAPDATTGPTLPSLALRAEASKPGLGRIYLIALVARDASGNETVCCESVVVPLRRSPGSVIQLREDATTACLACIEAGGVLDPSSGWILLRADQFQ